LPISLPAASARARSPQSPGLPRWSLPLRQATGRCRVADAGLPATRTAAARRTCRTPSRSEGSVGHTPPFIVFGGDRRPRCPPRHVEEVRGVCARLALVCPCAGFPATDRAPVDAKRLQHEQHNPVLSTFVDDDRPLAHVVLPLVEGVN